MKTLYLTSMALLLATGMVFAEMASPPQPGAQGAAQAVPAVDAKTFQGTVAEISLADPSQGNASQIVLMNEKGQMLELKVKPSTTIHDSNWNTISLEKVKKNSRASVEYIADKRGDNEAITINLVKS